MHKAEMKIAAILDGHTKGPLRDYGHGRLLAFSGIDGAGKSTQIQLFTDALKFNTIDYRIFWSRGGYTPGFELLKRFIRWSKPGSIPSPGRSKEREKTFGRRWVRRLWLTLAILDLALLYGVRIRWHLAWGRFVICDRYIWDTALDFRLNFPEESVDDWILWKTLIQISPDPDNTFILLIPIEECLRRLGQKKEPFPDSPEILTARITAYQEMAVRYEWQVIDCNFPVDKVSLNIWENIQKNGRG